MGKENQRIFILEGDHRAAERIYDSFLHPPVWAEVVVVSIVEDLKTCLMRKRPDWVLINRELEAVIELDLFITESQARSRVHFYKLFSAPRLFGITQRVELTIGGQRHAGDLADFAKLVRAALPGT